MKATKIQEITPENVKEETLFCVKDITNPGFEAKRKWFLKSYKEGLRILILKASDDRMIGFMEYVPAELAWRPIDGENFMFVHCLYIYSKKDRKQGYGSLLVRAIEKDAKARGMAGVCAMTSGKGWMAEKDIFENNGFKVLEKKDRFELLSKKWDTMAADPKLMDWTSQQSKFKGWHLLYANQCPWHEKSVEALMNVAMDFDIDLQVKEMETVQEAKKAPSGFGVFNLLHDGNLLEDHYLSATRFRNILKKELKRTEGIKSCK